MRIFAGTSGFSYKRWKGEFYPADRPDSEWLAYYSTRLPAVEINNTFYRMPRSAVMESWAQQVQPGFRFAVKASQRITHRARLREVDELIGYLWRAAMKLGDALGPVLFQLPPQMRKDVERLRGFLAGLPEGMRAAVEFRNASWMDDEVFDVLRTHGACLVAAESEGQRGVVVVPTADWGYVRMREAAYDAGELARCLEVVRGQPWREAYVFFKHDEDAPGPGAALGFAGLVG